MTTLPQPIPWDDKPNSVLLRGSEEFFINQAQMESRSVFPDHACTVFDSEEGAWKEDVQSYALFEEPRLLFMEDVHHLTRKSDRQSLIDAVGRSASNKDRWVLSTSSSASWIDDLADRVDIVCPCPTLDEKETIQWMQQRAESEGLDLPEEHAVRILRSQTGDDLASIDTELTKLFLYCRSQGVSDMNMEVIRPVVFSHTDLNPFEAVDAWMAKRQKKAWKILTVHYDRSARDPTFKLVGMFQSRIKRLLKSVSASSVREVIDSYYLRKKLQEQIQRWDKKELMHAYQVIRQVESGIKRGEPGQAWMDYFLATSIS